MPIKAHNLVRHELIGLKVRIASSSDPTHAKVSGRVIDESYNMLKIEAKSSKEKTISKSSSIFIFTLPNKTKVKVDGKVLIGRPEDRIKKKIAKW